MPTCNFTKKIILLRVFCLHFSQNASRLLFPKRLWKCASTISFRKYKPDKAQSSAICNLPVQLRFIQVNFLRVEYGISRSLRYSFYQKNWNSFSLAIIQRLQEHLSLFAVFWYVLFYKKVIVHQINWNSSSLATM